MKQAKIASLVLAVLLVLPVVHLPLAHATPLFGASVNLSNDNMSSFQQMATSGNYVYVVWTDGNDVWLRASSNNGGAFATAVSPSNSGGSGSTPYVAASGNNVYVVWIEADDAFIAKSTDNGGTFGAPVNLSNSGAASNVRVAASGSNVYVTWEEGSNLKSVASSNDGTSFSTIKDLSGTSSVSAGSSQLAASGTTAYAVWRDTTTGAGDIYFNTITNTGAASSAAKVNLSNNAGNSQTPQIAVSGTTAYVVWVDQTPAGSNGDILFSAVSDTGTISVDKINLSSNTGTSDRPKIAVDTNDVYVVWQDNISAGGKTTEVLFKHSSDNGANFGTQVNISNTSTDSAFPNISVSGSNVNVVWRDLITGNNGDIFTRSSPDKGGIFGGLKNLSADSATSDSPIVVTTGTYAYVTWIESTGVTPDVFFVAGAHSAKDIKFDATKYGTSSVVTITVTDSSSNTDSASKQTIDVAVTSTADATGIPLFRLTETDLNSGVFTAQLTLTTGSSSASPCTASCLLKVASTNTITATFSGQSTNAYTSARTLAFEFASYVLSDGSVGGTPVVLTLTDADANTDTTTKQSVDISVHSTTQPSDITLRLEETGIDTGIFKNTNLIFMRGDNIFTAGDSVTIKAQTSGLGHDSDNIVNTILANIKSTTSSGGFDLTLTETGPNTATFTGTLQISSTGPSGGSTIQVSSGDILSIKYSTGSIFANSIISPNPNQKIGAIKAAVGDTITASYQGTTGTATIDPDPAPGGGGGGIVQPTVVLNVIAGIFGGGGSSSGSSASPGLTLDRLNPKVIKIPDEVKQIIATFDKDAPLKPIPQDKYPDFNFPLSIGSSGYPLSGFSNTIETNTIKTNEKSSWKLTLYDPNLQHVSLYMDLRKGVTDPSQSDAQILYNVGAPVKVIDPKGYFGKVTLSQKEEGEFTNLIFLDITFAKPMEKSDLIIRTWNTRLFSMDTAVRDAIQVVQSTESTQAQQDTSSQASLEVQKPILPVEPTPQEPQQQPLEQKPAQQTQIPSWVKTNADWWSQGQIKDSEFVSGIQYLIQNQIVKVPETEKSEQANSEIPGWIKNNAGWWAKGDISDDDFVKGLQYLISHGIIKV